MTGRVCTICNAWKDWRAFYASKKSKNGHTTQCKECYRMRYLGPKLKPETIEPTHKRCAKCLNTMPKSCFHTNNRQKNKCVSRCKNCVSTDMKQMYAQKRKNAKILHLHFLALQHRPFPCDSNDT